MKKYTETTENVTPSKYAKLGFEILKVTGVQKRASNGADRAVFEYSYRVSHKGQMCGDTSTRKSALRFCDEVLHPVVVEEPKQVDGALVALLADMDAAMFTKTMAQVFALRTVA